MSQISRTARYEMIPDSGGNRYRFFCERSGMAVCTTAPFLAATPGEEARPAWETEGRRFFNFCQSCGKWVSDVMFNADTLQCVSCSPWEEAPHFCPRCGAEAVAADTFCRSCGRKLQYGGSDLQ